MLTLKAQARAALAIWRSQALTMPALGNAVYINAAYHLELMLTWDEPQFRQGLMQMYHTLLAMHLQPGMLAEASAALDAIQQQLSSMIGERAEHFDVAFDWPGNMRMQKAS